MTVRDKLSPEARELVRDIVAGLTGRERERERVRVKSKVLRMDDGYRQADNAKKAEAARKRYATDPVESRRKSLERWRRRQTVKDASSVEQMATD